MTSKRGLALAGLDPRAKLIVAFLFSIITVLSPIVLTQGFCLVTAFFLWLPSGVSWRLLGRRFLAVNLFILLAWLTLPWKLENGVFYLNANGCALALSITIKANAILLAWLALLASSPVSDILHALAHFRLPHKLLALFFLFDRYAFVLTAEYRRLRAALLVRGFKPRFNRLTFTTLAHLTGTMLIRGFDRAERVYQAMLCRGFKGTFYLIDHFHWQPQDTWWLLICVGWLLALGVASVFLRG